MTMNLRRKPNSTTGIGSGPAAEKRRGNVPAIDEPKRLLGFKVLMRESQMVGVAAKLEGLTVKDFCMQQIMPKTKKVLEKHGLKMEE